MLIENPPDYGVLGLWATRPCDNPPDKLNPRHCPLWQLPWMRSFLEATRAELLNFAQCTLDSEFQKYTTLAITPRWLEIGGAHEHGPLSAFCDRACGCAGKHAQRATGRDGDGGYHSRLAAAYPRGMKLAIGQAVLLLLQQQQPPAPVDFRRACGICAQQPAPVDAAARAQAVGQLERSLTSSKADEHCDPKKAGGGASAPAAGVKDGSKGPSKSGQMRISMWLMPGAQSGHESGKKRKVCPSVQQ